MSDDLGFEMEVVDTEAAKESSSDVGQQTSSAGKEKKQAQMETPSAKLWPSIPEDWKMVAGNEVYDANPTRYAADGEVDYIEMDALKTDLPDPKYVGRRDPSDYSGQMFAPGDTLFAQITPCTENGKAALVPELRSEVGIGSTEFIVLSPNRAKILPDYLYYLSKSHPVHNYAVSRMRGSTGRQRVPVDVFRKELQIPLPPLPEQRKIASILYAVDQAIQKTEEIIEQTKITKKGVLRRLYREGIRETELTHTPAGDTPEHWRISVLEDICDIGGGSTPRKKNEAYWGGNVLWASPKDFLGPVMQNTEDKLTEEGVDDCNSKVYEKGSTLIVVRSGILRRKLPIAKAGRPTTVNQDIKAVTPKDGEIDKEYLFQILHSHASRVRRNCMKVGTTVESIETSLLRKFPIKVPPLEEQKHIASIGFDFDQELRIEQEELKRLKRLKSGLMQDLLTGEVRTADRAIKVLEEFQAQG